MISYQPALDRYHTIFRMLVIVEHISSFLPIEVDKMRILDFFLAFPFRLETFKAKQGHGLIKKVGKSYNSVQPYGGMPDDTSLFMRMTPMQALAMDSLASHGFIQPDAYKQGFIMGGEYPPPDPLHKSVTTFVADYESLLDAIQILACDYSLLGNDGLKRRSGLLEHKYDAA